MGVELAGCLREFHKNRSLTYNTLILFQSRKNLCAQAVAFAGLDFPLLEELRCKLDKNKIIPHLFDKRAVRHSQ